MEITREDIRKILDRYGAKYRFDSPTPGIRFKDGQFWTSDQVPSAEELFGNLELMDAYQEKLLKRFEEGD
ncbi:hypothetical protein [Streptococcus sp. NLN76]|uniref:hypothetical protein n=1 Tax=Streptococcus sp. NLN76 TaxID=2822800 RepID=UPI0018ABE26D|nr:hypothetical protein [Streptococcus sp. NLN76]MBF8970991.1 hypothetical protein [Streptococcus sp. NLN76]